MTRYNKLWAAIGISIAFIAMKHFNVLPAGWDRLTVDTVQAALTSWGVYQIRNAE